MSKIHYAVGFEDTPIVLMDRIQGEAGANITQASITAITYDVFEYATQEDAETNTDGTAISADTALTKTSVVYDTLQTAAPWDSTKDATGYNFRFTLPAAARPNGGKWHRVEVWFEPASGDDFPVVWLIESKAVGRT